MVGSPVLFPDPGVGPGFAGAALPEGQLPGTPADQLLPTLAIAALFTPIRRRIQTFIDCSFYRQKYDAEQVLAAISTNLREEVDLDHLTNSILVVVEETMQPVHVSLWLRE